jgi:RNA polymerase sigma factor (sigma-70 family)
MQSEHDSDLGRLNRRFRPALMAFFLRRLKSHAEAEDMTQEVFLRLASTDAAQMQSADAYVFQTAANLLRDRGRREKVRAGYRAGALALQGSDVDPLDPLRITMGRESLSALQAGLRDLPERTRSIFILFRLENVDRRAIAEAFGMAISSVDRHLAKAAGHLAACLAEGDA